MIGFLRLMNRPCRDMTRLISAAQDRELSRAERFAVRTHLLYCTACRRFSRHVRWLREAISRLAGGEVPDQTAPRLSPDARERIKRSLSQP